MAQPVSKKKMLVVDDVELNRAILSELFSNSYEVIEAENGQQAIDKLKENSNDLAIILLDIVMPVMDGLTALEEIGRLGYLKSIPVVLLTAESTERISLKVYELGASDVISKPYNPAVVRQRVNNIVELYDYRHDLEEEVRRQTVILEEQAEKLKQTNVFVIDTLCTAVEFRNGESGSHISRIRDITRVLLKALGEKHEKFKMPDNQIDIIANAAAMHDIGKIAVPDAILNKPGRLTDEEFQLMKQHTIKGCEMLAKLDYVQDQEYYQYCYEICRHHHERWDGRGYPDGIKGDAIPIWAQVVSLADVYDALVSERPYKKALSHEVAIQMISDGECGQFNPEMLACFLEVEEQLKKQYSNIARNHEAPVKQLIMQPPKSDEKLQRIIKLLEIERAKYHIVADSSGDVVYEYDAIEDTIRFSENVSLVLDLPMEIKHMMDENRVPLLLHKNDLKVLHQTLDELRHGPKRSTRKMLRFMGKSGQYEWFELVARGFFNDDMQTPVLTDVIGKLVNVNELKSEATRWRTVAQRDPLTGLNNRSAFQEMVLKEMDRDSLKEGVMLFIDIDNFKQINDHFGHHTGDKILKYVGEQLKLLFRSSDILARMGGDEFVAFLPGSIEIQLLKAKTQLLCDSFSSAHTKTDMGGCHFSGSVGIARYPQDAKDYQSLVRYADEALYRAKTNGKNRFEFYGDE